MQYTKSIRLFTIIETIKGFWLGMLISILYLKFIGMNDVTISYFHLVIASGLLFFEIPTGYFADKFGYKKSIIMGNASLILFFASLVLAAYTHYMVALFVTAPLFALSSAFISGANSSYMFKAHDIDKRQDEYLQTGSRINLYIKVARAIAVPVGAYLYTMNEILPYAIQTGLLVVTTGIALFLKPIPLAEREHTITFWEHCKQSIHTFFKKKFLIGLMLFSLFGMLSFEFFNHIINQSFWMEKGFDVQTIGYMGIVIFLIDGFVPLLAPRLWKYFGETYIYPFMAVCALIIPTVLAYSDHIIPITIFSGLLFALYTFIIRILVFSVHRHISDQQRASVISVGSMATRFVAKLLLIAAGYGLAYVTYTQALLYVGLISGVGAIFFSYLYVKQFSHSK